MEFKEIDTIKSYSEAARKYLGVDYYNKWVKLKIHKLFKENGYDLDEIIKENSIIKPIKCLQCGEEFIPKFKGNKFCSSSCATKYNNLRRKPVSEKTKKKISETLLKRHYGENWKEHIEHLEKIACFTSDGKRKSWFLNKTPNHICKKCGKKFFSRKKDAKYCSKTCMHSDTEYIEKLRSIQQEKVKNGTHKGWQSRNLESYPEKFWKKVLDNNSITYKREDFSTKKYFLDFLIEKNGKKIDLEIDGKQHHDRKGHDKKRDKFLSENGFIVYRVEWNCINTDKGQEKMKQKIDDFVDFYNSL